MIRYKTIICCILFSIFLMTACFSCSGSLYDTEHSYTSELLRNDLDRDIVRLYLGMDSICEELKQTAPKENHLIKLYKVDAKIEQFLIFARLDTVIELEQSVSPQNRMQVIDKEFWDAGFSELPIIYQAVECFRLAYVKPLIALTRKDAKLTEEQLASWAWAEEQIYKITEETAKIKRGSSEDYLKPEQFQLKAVQNAVELSAALINRKSDI